MLELAFLVVGLLALTSAIVVVVTQRIADAETQATTRPGLLAPEDPLEVPTDLRPGMITALTDGEVSLRDIRLTLLDLAARGHLVLTTTQASSGRPTWELSHSLSEDAQLLGYEQLLLDLIPEHPVLLNELMNNPARPLDRVQDALAEHVSVQQWFATTNPRPHSRWGWVGAIVLILGLLATASMLIDWVATNDFRGVIGGLAVVAAGILLASRGRVRSLYSPAGRHARNRVEALTDGLQHVRPEQILLTTVDAEFGRLLPWAVAIGTEKTLARAVDDELRRAGNWGQQSRLQLPWLHAETDEPAASAQELSTQIATVVNRKANGRSRPQRVVSHA